MRTRIFKYLYYNRKKSVHYIEERRPKMTIFKKSLLYLNLMRKIEIPFLDLDVNTVCDLRCTKCAKCIPYFEKKEYYTAEDVIDNLEKLLKFVDKIYALSIIGGEPFLNSDIAEVISFCSNCKKIQDVDITTNATVIPDETVFRVLADSRAIVYISDYKLNNTKFMENKKLFIQKLNDYGIPYRIILHENWLDFGLVEKHSYCKKQLKMMYYCCPMNSCNIYNQGKLYRCGRASYIDNHSIGELKDVIDINMINNRTQMRKKIHWFYSRSYSSACEYCSYKPVNVIPGIQIGENQIVKQT